MKEAHHMIHDAASSGSAAIDPVCKMSVDPASATATRTFEGDPYYFCSDWCAEQFDEDPASFVYV